MNSSTSFSSVHVSQEPQLRLCDILRRRTASQEQHMTKDAWLAATWKQAWEASGPTRVHYHVSDPGEGVKGEELSRIH